jgi:hypothetical protein
MASDNRLETIFGPARFARWPRPLSLVVNPRKPCDSVHASTIRFFSRDSKFSALSNFAPYGCEVEGVKWPTMEHYAANHYGDKPGPVAYPRNRNVDNARLADEYCQAI